MAVKACLANERLCGMLRGGLQEVGKACAGYGYAGYHKQSALAGDKPRVCGAGPKTLCTFQINQHM